MRQQAGCEQERMRRAVRQAESSRMSAAGRMRAAEEEGGR
jgi:hypothetical protein